MDNLLKSDNEGEVAIMANKITSPSEFLGNSAFILNAERDSLSTIDIVSTVETAPRPQASVVEELEGQGIEDLVSSAEPQYKKG